MAVTKIIDVVVPEVYNDYFMENSIYKSALWRSGIIASDPRMAGLLQGGAKIFNIPFWKANDVIGADASPVDEDTTLTPASMGSGQMIARRQFREKAFGQNDVAAVLAGKSPVDEMISLTERFWNRNYQAFVFNSVRGVIADNIVNDAGDMIKDITGDVDPTISSGAVIDTLALFGDADEDLSAIAMHSVPYNNLRKDNLIDFTPDNEQNIGWGTYLGKSVIVDDTLIVDSTYWSILFKPGAVAFAEDISTALYEPTEVERNPESSGGQTVYYTRRVFLIHPYGFAWSDDAAPAADFPTDSELQLAANWNRVVSNVKNVGFAVLKSTG
jgi:hypothetical protein